MGNALSHKLTPFLLIVGAALFSFGLTLTVDEFIWDDHPMIETNPFVREASVRNVIHAFSGDVFEGRGDEYYRPLQTLQNLLDFQLWELNARGYHLTNLAYHTAAACLLFVLIRRLVRDENIALISALCFAVHPVVIEQLLIIAGRAEIMALAFTVGAMVSVTQKGCWRLPVSTLLYALACLSKESGIVFPLFVLLIGWLKPRYRVPRYYYLGYGAVAAGYLVLRSFAVSSGYLMRLKDVQPLLVVRDLPVIVFEYVRIILLPLDLHSHRLFRPFGWYSLIGYAGLGLIGLFYWRLRSKLFRFGCLWFLVGVSPKIPLLLFQLGLSHPQMLDHWVYPSAVGVFIVMAMWVSRLNSKRVTASIVVVVLLFWSGVSWANTIGRGTDKKMYLWALQYPTSAIVRHNLALIYLSEGNLAEAEKLASAALAMWSDPANALLLARVKHRLGENEEALKIVTEWAGRTPDYAPLLVTRASIVRGEEGLRDLYSVLRRNPRDIEAWALLAEINGELEHVDQYKAALQKMVEIDPSYPGVRHAQSLAAVNDYTRMFYDGELTELYRYFTDEMKTVLPLAQLNAVRDEMLSKYGHEIHVVGQDDETRGEYRGFVRWARFDGYDGVIELQWILQQDDSIAAFFVRPADRPPGSSE